MHTLIKAAAAIHHLALATAFGGPLYAKKAMYGAVLKNIPDEKERARVLTAAWLKFEKINVPAHLLFTATWLMERKAIKEYGVDERTQKLVGLKDVFIAGALATGLANALATKAFKREFPQGVAVHGGEHDTATTTTSRSVEKYKEFFKVSGPLNMLFVAGSIAISPYIAAGIIRSTRRGLLGRLVDRLLGR